MKNKTSGAARAIALILTGAIVVSAIAIVVVAVTAALA